MPTISVIVPVYNVEKYLRCCVDSILAQTFTDIEVLLVDDGSTDSSGAICDEYAKKDSRVRVFHKENGGVSSARNLGIDQSRGNWIMFVDSDDKVDSEICEVLYSYAGDKIMPLCRLRNYDENYVDPVLKTELSSMTYSISKFDCIPTLGPVAKLYEKKLIGNSIRFNEKFSFAEDALFNCEYYRFLEEFTVINNRLYYYRILPNSLSHGRYIPYFLETIMAIREARVKLGKKLGLTEEEILNKEYYTNLLYSLCVAMNNNMHKDAPGNWIEKIRINNRILRRSDFQKCFAYIDSISKKDFTKRYLIMLRVAYYTGNYFGLWLIGVPGMIKEVIKRKR